MEKDKTLPGFFARNAALLKIALLGLLVLVMTVPLEYVWSVIQERAYLSRAVERELGESWGRAQTVAGPVLILPIEEPETVKVRAPGWTAAQPVYVEEQEWHRRHLYILPEEQSISASLASQTRKRGIYEALLYTVASETKGAFRLPAATALPVKQDARLLWDQARLLVHIADLRGSANAPQLQWGDQRLPFDVRSEPLLGGGDSAEALEALNRASAFLRSQLGREVHLRHMPRLSFQADGSFDEAQKINALLHKPRVSRDIEQPDAGASDPGESDPGIGGSRDGDEDDGR